MKEKRENLRADEYRDCAIAYCLSHGGPVVISRREDPEAWAEWIEYFQRKRLPGSVRMMRSMAQKWTVPTSHPPDFDSTFRFEGERNLKSAADTAR